MNLRGAESSFVTIQPSDRGPDPATIAPGQANADDSVGMIVDISNVNSVSSVCSGHSAGGGFGDPPTAETCAASIDNRQFSNEWRVKNYTPCGIFVFEPIWVYVHKPERGDKAISLSTVLEAFPEERIFTAREDRFMQYDRASTSWHVVNYDDIIPG